MRAGMSLSLEVLSMRPTAWAAIAVSLVAASATDAQALRIVGHSNLGGSGLNGDVTVIGTTAIVAAGLMPAAGVHAHLYNPYPCPAVAVKLVDLSEPRRPRVVATIPVPAYVLEAPWSSRGPAARRRR